MFSFGFYNSKDGDRKYNATHLGKLFDGIIQDGVFGAAPEPLNNMFNVVPKEQPNLQVTLNPGKAWLMHTWNILDSKTTITFNQAQANYKRTDAIVIEVNNDYTDLDGSNPRENSIKIVEGPNVLVSNPDVLPVLTQVWNAKNTDRRIWQYPIAFVTIYGSDYNGGTTETQFEAKKIKASNIKNRVNPTDATDATKFISWIPLVTGATMNMTLDNYVPDYVGLFDQFMLTNQAEFNNWFDDLHNTVVIDESAQAALTQLNIKIDQKMLYGSQLPPATLESGQVYFQIEE